MNIIKWLIYEDIFSEDEEKEKSDLIKALKEAGVEFELFTRDNLVFDITKTVNVDLNSFSNSYVYFPYGSISFVNRAINVFKKYGCSYYLDKEDKNFLVSNYTYHYKKYMLNTGNIDFLPYWQWKEITLDSINIGILQNKYFVRPNSGNKPFPGQAIIEHAYGGFQSALDFITNYENIYNCDFDEMMVMSDFCDIQEEYRFIVSRDEVVTGCKYIKDGSAVNDTADNKYNLNAKEFLTEALNDVEFKPGAMFVADVAREKMADHRNYKIIEFNSINTSFFYNGLESNRIVNAVMDTIHSLFC